MEPIKVLMFGTEDIYSYLKPYYEHEISEGNMQIVGYGFAKNESDGGVFTFLKIWNVNLWILTLHFKKL